MLLDFQGLGVGLIVKIRQVSEATLGPEAPHNRWAGVLFSTYEVDVLIDDKIQALRIEVAHDMLLDDYRIDWATTRGSGRVTQLDNTS